MSKLDIAKESIAYLKFWLGVTIVSEMSLLSWVFAHAETATNDKIYATVASVVIVGMIAFYLHKRIERLILKLEDL